MPARPALPRTIAIDWSGAARRAEQKIWLAECVRDDASPLGARVVRLESGRTREALVAHLLDDATRDPNVVIALDFSFSLPAWVLAQHGVARPADAWVLAAREGERWLAECRPPFWGRPGRARPRYADGRDDWRRTERALAPVAGIRPKSTLQLGGAGAVGTGAVRGMPHLRTLRSAGFAIWPFDDARLPAAPLVVELYPRLLTGPVAKGRADARAAHLDRQLPGLDATHRHAAERSEDAFDALVSAVAMARVADQFAALTAATDDLTRLEGAIWHSGGDSGRITR